MAARSLIYWHFSQCICEFAIMTTMHWMFCKEIASDDAEVETL